MKTIEFRGYEIEYNEKVFKSWKFQRQYASLEGPAQMFATYDAVLDGKADEVAELLGDDVDAMGDLLAAITADIDGEAKN